MTAATVAGGPCLSCRRPLTMRTSVDGGRPLFVCDGHSPRVHRDVLTAVMAAEADGHTLAEVFGTMRCPGCGTSAPLSGLHVPGGQDCRELADERTAKAGQ